MPRRMTTEVEDGQCIEEVTPDEITGLGILEDGDMIRLYNKEGFLIAVYRIKSKLDEVI